MLKEMTPTRLSGTQSQQLAVQALHSSTAQTLAEFCLDHGRHPDPEFVADSVAVIVQQGTVYAGYIVLFLVSARYVWLFVQRLSF